MGNKLIGERAHKLIEEFSQLRSSSKALRFNSADFKQFIAEKGFAVDSLEGRYIDVLNLRFDREGVYFDASTLRPLVEPRENILLGADNLNPGASGSIVPSRVKKHQQTRTGGFGNQGEMKIGK